MSKPSFVKIPKPMRRAAMLACAVATAALLAGCEPAYNTRPGYGGQPSPQGGYYGGQPPSQGGYYGGNQQCYQGCGYVRDIREVQLGNNNSAAVGTVIGAVVGGLLGHQVGKGNGKTAATVAGAVGGGFAGHAIGSRSGNGDYGWQVVVQLQNGQYATVTQRNPPQVQPGDYVMIREDQVYRY
ncbi:MAG TPA: glycine zipper 2TM domain-containing protein [Rhodanobacteraceae bacterium]|nr:glycine zipper 2TM domain-containing protein [Rhodanobacteraceae bacterium]